jgi:hypothetical protein
MNKIVLLSLFIVNINIPSCCKKVSENSCALDVCLFISQSSDITIVYKNNKKENIRVSEHLHITESQEDSGFNGYFRLFDLTNNKEIKSTTHYSFLFDPMAYNNLILSPGKSQLYELRNPFVRQIEKVTYKLVYYPQGLEFCQDSIAIIYKEE